MRHDENINQLLEATAYDRNGEKIGSVSGVYLDDHSGEPMWVTVNTGFFGLSSSFAPLAGSSLDGDRLTLAADKAAVKDAPNIDEDGHITREQEDELYRFYQVESAELDADVMRTRRWGHEGTAAAGGVAAGGLLDRDADGRGPLGEVLDGPDHDRYDDHVEGGGLLDRDADGRGPLGEVLDGPDHDRYDDHVEGGGLLDRDADGRGPLGEVLDGPDHDRYDDHVEGGGLLDRDADGRGPLGEVLDGPDVSQDPAYRNDPAFLEDRASDGNERYVTDERLVDQRHDEHGLGEEFVDGGLSERPDAGDGPLSERGRASNPIEGIFDDTDGERPRNVN